MSSAIPAPTARMLPVLLLLFFGSGCAALIYEIVWFQMLQLVIGSSAVSLAVLLGTFMGGMCFGSISFSSFVSRKHHPLRVYAFLELGIGLAGVVVLFAMPAIGRLYTAAVGYGAAGISLRAIVCAVCLLPPTVLMGATLPAIARWIERSPRGVSWLGLFYGGNTVGAVVGCMVAGFYLLRLHDNSTATFFAVALNGTIGVVALLLTPKLAAADQCEADDSTAATESKIEPSGTLGILLAVGLSGCCALAAEVIWTRILSLMLGATVYTFSIILAVFLTGLALGSSAGAALARHTVRPRFWFAVCQLILVVAVAWAAHAMASVLPYWVLAGKEAAAPLTKFQFDLLRCACAMLPAAIMWGASFPLALAAMATPGTDPSRLVGRTYAANTLGAIVGAVATGIVLIPAFGTQRTQIAVLVVSMVAGLILLTPRGRLENLVAIAGASAAALAAFTLPQIPWELIAYGRQITTSDYGAKAIYRGEGVNASVAVSETPGGARFFHVSGKTEASSLMKDMRLQRMLGHIPALLHPEPRSVLIVGCGAGVTAGSFVLHPSIERIVICDIEPLIPRVVATHFGEENHNVVHDPRVEIVYDDARHFIATTSEKFDLITSDPIHPWVKGSAVLYSQEYFELCKRRLKPGGLVTQWVPLYEADRAVIKSEIATFFSVFPHGTIWANDDDGYGYDTVMLGQVDSLAIDIETLQSRFDRTDHARVHKALVGLGLGSAIDLLSTYTGRFADLKGWLSTAEINRDRNLRLQYLAGLQLDSNTGVETYDEMLKYRSFPSDLFQGSTPQLERLQRAFVAPSGLNP